MFEIKFTKQATKEIPNLKSANLENIVKHLIELLKFNPFQNPPPYEKLKGNFLGAYSRRINRKHRLVYEVIESKNTVKIITMWTHYENI